MGGGGQKPLYTCACKKGKTSISNLNVIWTEAATTNIKADPVGSVFFVLLWDCQNSQYDWFISALHHRRFRRSVTGNCLPQMWRWLLPVSLFSWEFHGFTPPYSYVLILTLSVFLSVRQVRHRLSSVLSRSDLQCGRHNGVCSVWGKTMRSLWPVAVLLVWRGILRLW